MDQDLIRSFGIDRKRLSAKYTPTGLWNARHAGQGFAPQGDDQFLTRFGCRLEQLEAFRLELGNGDFHGLKLDQSNDQVNRIVATHDRIPFTIFVPVLVMLVRRWFAPWLGKVNISWSKPSWCRRVAWRSCTETRSLTAS